MYMPNTYIIHDPYTVYDKTVEGENFRSFRSFCSITKVFHSLLQEAAKFSRGIFIFGQSVKIFPLDCFIVYGMFKIDVTMVNFYHATIVVILTNNPIGCTDDGGSQTH